MTRRFACLAGPFVFAVASLPAQSVIYPDFSAASTLLRFGDATIQGAVLRLTDNGVRDMSWAWHNQQLPVVGGFDTSFVFRITPPPVGSIGEGMAFVIQGDPLGPVAYGGADYGLGYGRGLFASPGIRNSIAVELDTLQNQSLFDISDNEVSIHTRGSLGNDESENYALDRTTAPITLADGQAHTLRIRYVVGTIDVFVDGIPTLSKSYDLLAGGTYLAGNTAPAPAFAQGAAWFGFTATTGAGSIAQRTEVLSWTWKSTPLVDACYEGNVGGDVLTVEGSPGDFLRTVRLFTYQPFDINLVPPVSYGPGAPYVLFGSLAPMPGAPGTGLSFGTTCFPLSGNPGLLTLAESFGFFSAWFPTGPLPQTLSLPAGLVTIPLDVTLQAVVGRSANPFALGVSNAVTLRFLNSPPPVIGAATPSSALPGQPITVNIENLVTGFTLTAGGQTIVPSAIVGTTVTFPFPAGLPCGSQLTVSNPNGASASTPLNPVPAIASTNPLSGPAAGNTIVVVSGQGFAPGTTVTVGGVTASIIVASATVVVFRTPPATPSVAPVVVTTPGGCSVSFQFTYL
ncbi:MAG TPA: IPT/TIG domain-containing protein [Planctomycetota bacterium]|nr:IPT/TIG domain-containing protein [Planctomycetota bacterium]